MLRRRVGSEMCIRGKYVCVWVVTYIPCVLLMTPHLVNEGERESVYVCVCVCVYVCVCSHPSHACF